MPNKLSLINFSYPNAFQFYICYIYIQPRNFQLHFYSHQTTLNIFLNIVLLTRRLKIALRAIGCRFKEKKKKKAGRPSWKRPLLRLLLRRRYHALARARLLSYILRARYPLIIHTNARVYIRIEAGRSRL